MEMDGIVVLYPSGEPSLCSFSKVAVELTTSMKKRRRQSLKASGWQSVSVRAARVPVWLVEPRGWND